MQRVHGSPKTSLARPNNIIATAHVAELNARNHMNLGVSSLKRNRDSMNRLDMQPSTQQQQCHQSLQQQQARPTQHQQDQLELQRLRAQLEERDKEIAALRQAAIVKDRKLEQLNNRWRKEQMRHYYRFMELEPVVELEEDAAGSEDSPTSSGPPSLSPPPYTAEYWSEDPLYTGLLREHTELQRSHHALELRLKRSEARARAANERIQQAQAEAQEMRELAELQEFRILELEGAVDSTSLTTSPAPDTRDVCTDTENDDVSDSGVLSLPASEDVASDSDQGVHDLKMDLPYEELKEKILALARTLSGVEDKWCLHQVAALLEDGRIASPINTSMTQSMKSLPDYSLNGNEPKYSTRIVATVPPFNEMLQPPLPLFIHEDAKNNKLLGVSSAVKSKKASGGQEGVGVEVCSQGTQTDSVAVPSHGDLRAEIQKLNQFRERVEERGGDLAFCRERLSALEDKIRLYESNDSAQTRLLNERLEKERALAAQVEQLTLKLAQMRQENASLEEQRCEMEEAENDTRLRCQKLELKLQIMSDEKCDLQSKLLQEKRTSTNLKSNITDAEKWRREACYLQSVLKTYEESNYELVERETDLRHQLETLSLWWPAVLAWNVLRTIHPRRENGRVSHITKDIAVTSCRAQCRETQDRFVQIIGELEDLVRVYVSRERVKKVTVGVTADLKEPVHTNHNQCLQQLQQAKQVEVQLRNTVKDLEQKEKAFMETLQEADVLWSELENDHQQQVQKLQTSQAELKARLEAAESHQRQQRSTDHEVTELEQTVCETAASLRKTEEERATLAARVVQLSDALATADASVEKLNHEVEQVLKPKINQERRVNASLQKEIGLKNDAMENMQDTFDKETEKLKNQVAALTMENTHLNSDCDELKSNVEKLEEIVKQHQELLRKEKDKNEKALAKLSNLLAEKERELHEVTASTKNERIRSAREEIEEAEASRYQDSEGESEDENTGPQYSTFPRASKEKTVLPPIKPPRRVKKFNTNGDLQRKEVKPYRNTVLESFTILPSEPLDYRRDPKNPLKGIVSSRNMFYENLKNESLQTERAPTPIPGTRQEVKSPKSPYSNYLSSVDMNKCQNPREIPEKSSAKSWRSHSDSLRKPRWLTELSVRVNESSRAQSCTFPVKRSILYWDNMNPKVQLKVDTNARWNQQ